MTNVLIVEDERNVVKGFRSDIESAPDRYLFVDAIRNAADATVACSLHHIDLILMDINTENNESGLAATEKLKRLYPDIKVIITTSYLDYRAVEEAKRIGADSFWLKDLTPVDLLKVMDECMAGRSYFPEMQPDTNIGETRFSSFTPTEQEVLFLLMEYISVKKIAEKMYVSEITVKKHLQHMCEKVNCDGKSELLLLATSAKIVLPKLKIRTKND